MSWCLSNIVHFYRNVFKRSMTETLFWDRISEPLNLLYYLRIRRFFLGGKMTGRGADNSPPWSATLRICANYLHARLRFHGVLNRYRDNFNLSKCFYNWNGWNTNLRLDMGSTQASYKNRYSGWDVKLSSHLHPVSILRMRGDISLTPTHLHSMALRHLLPWQKCFLQEN